MSPLHASHCSPPLHPPVLLLSLVTKFTMVLSYNKLIQEDSLLKTKEFKMSPLHASLVPPPPTPPLPHPPPVLLLSLVQSLQWYSPIRNSFKMTFCLRRRDSKCSHSMLPSFSHSCFVIFSTKFSVEFSYWLFVSVCMRVCMCSRDLLWLCFGSLLRSRPCAPIWRNSTWKNRLLLQTPLRQKKPHPLRGSRAMEIGCAASRLLPELLSNTLR